VKLERTKSCANPRQQVGINVALLIETDPSTADIYTRKRATPSRTSYISSRVRVGECAAASNNWIVGRVIGVERLRKQPYRSLPRFAQLLGDLHSGLTAVEKGDKCTRGRLARSSVNRLNAVRVRRVFSTRYSGHPWDRNTEKTVRAHVVPRSVHATLISTPHSSRVLSAA
jgi:hypothetical protein